MDKTINAILKKIGLNQKEILVYSTLLEYRVSNVARVAKSVDLPRQTVYSIIQGLVDEGIIEQSDKAGVKQFFADPNTLLSFLEKKKKIFDLLAKDFEKELPALLEKQRKGKTLPKVQYYDGEDGLKKLLQNILDQYKNGTEKIFRGYGINFYSKTHIHDFLRSFVQERYDYGVQTKLLVGKGDNDFEISKNKLGREVKQLDIDPQEAGVYLVGSRIYLFSFKDDVGVMIENESIVNMFKSIFDVDWNKS